MTKVFIVGLLIIFACTACGVKLPPLPPLTPEQQAKADKAQAEKDAKREAQEKAIQDLEKSTGKKLDEED